MSREAWRLCKDVWVMGELWIRRKEEKLSGLSKEKEEGSSYSHLSSPFLWKMQTSNNDWDRQEETHLPFSRKHRFFSAEKDGDASSSWSSNVKLFDSFTFSFPTGSARIVLGTFASCTSCFLWRRWRFLWRTAGLLWINARPFHKSVVLLMITWRRATSCVRKVEVTTVLFQDIF